MVTNAENKTQNIQLLSVKELAKMLSLSKRQVHRLRSAGKIGPEELRIGGSIRFRVDEVCLWLSSTPSCADRKTWQAMKQAGCE